MAIVMVRLGVTALLAVATSPSFGVYRCTDAEGKVVYVTEALAIGCVKVETEAVNTVPFPKSQVSSGRALRVGDRTREGLVVEIRGPIAKLQQDTGEKWMRIDELHPVEAKARAK